jgi:hypothetical protein
MLRALSTSPGPSSSVRRSDFWERLTAVLAPEYAPSWAEDVVLPTLGVTVTQAFERGDATVDVWRAVCATIEVPAHLT